MSMTPIFETIKEKRTIEIETVICKEVKLTLTLKELLLIQAIIGKTNGGETDNLYNKLSNYCSNNTIIFNDIGVIDLNHEIRKYDLSDKLTKASANLSEYLVAKRTSMNS